MTLIELKTDLRVGPKEYSRFDHSDFPAHSVFTFGVRCGSVGISIFRNQVQPQLILDPFYFPDHFPVSYDYGMLLTFFLFNCNQSMLLNISSGTFA